MRKPPMIAFAALTALGASAMTAAPATSGAVAPRPARSVSSTSRTHRDRVHLTALFARHRAARRLLAAWSTRDLVVAHDILHQRHLDLSPVTGLPGTAGHKATSKTAPRKHHHHQHHHHSRRDHDRAATASNPPVSQTASPAPYTPSGGVWYELRLCESGDNYSTDTGNGYYGAYQFLLSTWQELGYSGLPSNASPAVQDQAAARLQAMRGWSQWPQCAAVLGLG